MTGYIEVTVRVPADLEVVHESPTVRWMHLPGDKFMALFYCNPQDQHWVAVVGQQIAAAVEARKPRPPKFQVGDVVEWRTMGGEHLAGVVSYVHSDRSCDINGARAEGTEAVEESALKLVRRAEK